MSCCEGGLRTNVVQFAQTCGMTRLDRLKAVDFHMVFHTICEQRATPSLQSTNSAGNSDPVRIKSSKEKPADAFAAVQYRNQWFWVDDRDWRSKRAFTATMFLFTMAETGADEKLPLITIPAQ